MDSPVGNVIGRMTSGGIPDEESSLQ